MSFDFGKILQQGEGGCILTNNKKIYEYCKQYHDHGHELILNFLEEWIQLVILDLIIE